MRQVKLYQYKLPMDSGVILRDQRLSVREGYIVELCQDGKVGRGEIAPLAGFSVETLAEAGQQAQSQLELWQAGHEFDYSDLHPSVAFGLSAAIMELSDGLPIDGAYQFAPLCVGDPDELIPVLNEMPGEKVAKIKVGLYEPIRDGMLVNLFLESIPELTLRLDANRAWTPEKAHKFAQYINPSYRQRIVYLEEPCQQPGDSFSLAIDTGIAIAWDETLQEAVRRPDFKLADLTGAKTIVIKPTLIGSIERCVDLVAQAKKLGMKAVISSSIESSLGLCQLARMAKWLTPDQLPGLDTLSMFQVQLDVAWPKSQLPLVTLDSQELVYHA